MARTLRYALISAAAAAAAAAAYLLWFGLRPLAPAGKTYVVAPGTSLHAFSRRLYAEGVLPDPYGLVLWARLTGRGRALKAGEYRFEPGLTALQMLDQVTAGRVVTYSFTIIEGWTFRQVKEALGAAPKLRRTLEDLTPSQIMARLGRPGTSPEGRFLPETYRYSAGTTDVALLRRAMEAMTEFLQAEWRGREPGLPLEDAEEALILASIVEKEAARVRERRMIAAVLLNRLRRGMRLQADPTVIYGLGPAFDGNLRSRDLKRDTPYNTYTRPGLPPTPIAMPGRDAVRAVLHPAKTRALYFVARGDGSHHFSETLAEHNRAVMRYQLAGKARRAPSHPAPGAEDERPESP